MIRLKTELYFVAPLMRKHLSSPPSMVYISHVTNYTINNEVISFEKAIKGNGSKMEQWLPHSHCSMLVRDRGVSDCVTQVYKA